MAKNEFGVESSDSGGFGAGVGNDFEYMFEEAISVSVVDDEVSATRRSRSPRPVFAVDEAPVDPPAEVDHYVEPIAAEVVESEPALELDPELSFGSVVYDIDTTALEESEELSSTDDDSRNLEASSNLDDSFDSFGDDQNSATEFSSFDSFDQIDQNQGYDEPIDQVSYEDTTQWDEPLTVESHSIPEPFFEPEPEPELAYSPPTPIEPEREPELEDEPSYSAPIEPEPVYSEPTQPEPVYYAPTIADPTPSFVPETAVAPVVAPIATEVAVDYIERVILTSDAIRDLSESDAKAVNMFITAGQPVDSHQELVLTALLADRQILKTAEAILEAKLKTSVDRAFHILGLDDETFVDFGKILSHDLESTETAIFEGDRLQYARKLVDVVEALPAVSVNRFEAVRSVLGAGELGS